MDPGKKYLNRPPNPLYKANFFSKITLAWTFDIFRKGFKRDLELSDIFIPLEEHTSSTLGDIIEKNWNAELVRATEHHTKPSFLRVLCYTFGVQLFLLGVILALADITLKVLQPLFLAQFLAYYDTGNTLSKQEAYFYASGVILCSALQTIILQPFWMSMFKLGMKIRISCCSLLYRKALRLSKTALGQTSIGQITNLMTNDVSKLDMFVLLVNYLWVGPLLTIIITYYLWLEIGPSAFVGVAALLLFVPVLMWLGKEKSLYRLRTAKRTDDRIFLMNEIITGIQVIKMYTWEQPFAYLVSQVRKLEIKEIRGSSYIQGIMISFLVFHSRFAMFCSIISYMAFGNFISASVVYVVSSYFNILRTIMSDLYPLAISSTAEALMSIKRLQEFMNYNESSMRNIKYKHHYQNFSFLKSMDVTESYKKIQTDISNYGQHSISQLPLVFIKDATATWREDTKINTLNNINISFKYGELAVIIGPVGSGKSSLLNVILKELPLQYGDISIPGVVSYASQEPWIFGESVRQNILFDSPYNEVRYKQVVRACALKKDFVQFPFGDQTLVGDRGIGLSGGQRARINLARAVYKEADIYLLDDPLSAVDTAVGKHLFDECITGYLKGKTCILVTHQLQYLSHVDHIILLISGTVKAEGSYKQLQSSEENFLKLLEPNQPVKGDEEGKYKHQYSISTVEGDTSNEEQKHVEEIRQRGNVQGSVLKTYLLAGGHWCVIILVLLTFVLTQFIANGGDYWLNYWVNLEEYIYNKNSTINSVSPVYLPIIFDESTFIIGFSIFIAATIIICLVRSFIFFYICLRSSTWLHNNLFTSITRTSMRFFSINPSGRILNRFTKDIGAVDETVPSLLFEVLQIALDLVGIICIVMIVNIWLIFPTAIIISILYVLRKFYMKTSQSVKRLEGIARSPVVSHLNASLQGLTTIRAFKSEPILQKEFDDHQDLHTSAWFLFIATRRAFGYCTDVICLIFVSIVTMSFLILDKVWLGGDVGLAITQSISITNFFQWGMRQSAELENNLTSVERVMEYCELEKEPPLTSAPDKTPAESWPQEGRLEFSHVSLSYGPELPLVLKDLNFVVQPKEKIGIVGRTGAGKSSLITAMFRLAEVQGQLIIDGIDVQTIGLHDLRSKLSIIPQEPVLFSGSIRMNLDPFDEFPDEIIWSALDEVQLKHVVKESEGGLAWKVSEGGGNFSVGQRQLICLARAIIRNNKILVLDEATANVDHQTDALIQRTMRHKFLDCTVLTIAHRLHTVMDADKILVMDNGCIVEYDHPYTLLSNKESFLYKMAQQTGKITSDTLHDMALMNYKSKTIGDTDIS